MNQLDPRPREKDFLADANPPPRLRAGILGFARSGLRVDTACRDCGDLPNTVRASCIFKELVLRYISTRLLYMVPVIWLVVSVVFLLIHLVPGDPIQQMLGEGAASADVQAARHAYGLDVPLPQQYVNYWKGVLRGDLGRSLRFDQPVTGVILQRYPKTILLTVASMIVALLISIPAGVRSARRRNRWDDRLLSVVSLWGLSFPNFALGPILILFFAIRLGLLPVSGYGTFAHLVLPAITMGGALAAILTRMVRTAMLEELGQDYIRTARAKGLVRKCGGLQARAAQRAGACVDRGGTSIRRAACRRHRYRNNFFLARHRTPHHQRHQQPRLLPRPGLHPHDRPYVCGRELPDRFLLLAGQSADSAVACSHPERSEGALSATNSHLVNRTSP